MLAGRNHLNPAGGTVLVFEVDKEPVAIALLGRRSAEACAPTARAGVHSQSAKSATTTARSLCRIGQSAPKSRGTPIQVPRRVRLPPIGFGSTNAVIAEPLYRAAPIRRAGCEPGNTAVTTMHRAMIHQTSAPMR
jgi:hypothetical protein